MKCCTPLLHTSALYDYCSLFPLELLVNLRLSFEPATLNDSFYLKKYTIGIIALQLILHETLEKICKISSVMVHLSNYAHKSVGTSTD